MIFTRILAFFVSLITLELKILFSNFLIRIKLTVIIGSFEVSLVIVKSKTSVPDMLDLSIH